MHQTKIEKGARITGDARTILVADVKYKYAEQGMTIRAIVEQTGRAYGTVHRMLTHDAGVQLRTRRGTPRST